jgi:hypothetical protein
LRVTAREVMHLANTNTEQRLGHYFTFGALFNPVVLSDIWTRRPNLAL